MNASLTTVPSGLIIEKQGHILITTVAGIHVYVPNNADQGWIDFPADILGIAGFIISVITVFLSYYTYRVSSRPYLVFWEIEPFRQFSLWNGDITADILFSNQSQNVASLVAIDISGTSKAHISVPITILPNKIARVTIRILQSQLVLQPDFYKRISSLNNIKICLYYKNIHNHVRCTELHVEFQCSELKSLSSIKNSSKGIGIQAMNIISERNTGVWRFKKNIRFWWKRTLIQWDNDIRIKKGRPIWYYPPHWSSEHHSEIGGTLHFDSGLSEAKSATPVQGMYPFVNKH